MPAPIIIPSLDKYRLFSPEQRLAMKGLAYIAFFSACAAMHVALTEASACPWAVDGYSAHRRLQESLVLSAFAEYDTIIARTGE